METNNKLREALMQIYDRVNSLDENCAVDPVEIRGIARAALAEPVKNCEVGTLEDRRERFKRFCKSHSSRVACDRNCPLFKLHINGYSCHFEWGELPFESKEQGK